MIDKVHLIVVDMRSIRIAMLIIGGDKNSYDISFLISNQALFSPWEDGKFCNVLSLLSSNFHNITSIYSKHI